MLVKLPRFGIARPEKTVFCLDGDGAILMHMGSLASIGQSKAKNFMHICFNNGSHGSVGGQKTLATNIDLVKIAEATGYQHCEKIKTSAEIKGIFTRTYQFEGPSFFELIVNKDFRKDLGRPTSTPVQNKKELIRYLGEKQLSGSLKT